MTWTIEWIEHALQNHVELAIFLVLSLGHLIGRLRIGPLKLNPVIGVLLAGVVVGQARIEVPGVVQWMFFLLFLFSVGYKTGPQFFRGFGWNALPQVILAALLGVVGLATTYAVSRLWGFDAGTAAGLLAGGLNASPAVGTATDAISRLAVGENVRRSLSADVTVAFAVTYFAGLFAAILVLVRIGPWLMRVDLRSECKQLEEQLGMRTAEEGVVSAHRPFVTRSYKLPENLDEKTVTELERTFAPERVFVERVKTAHGMIDATPGTRLRVGDIIVLSGRSRVLANRNNPLHLFEVDDPLLSDIPIVSVDHVLRRKDLIHRTLAEIVEILGGEAATRGVFVRKILRAGDEVPLGSDVRLERGDVLTLIGASRNIERVAAQLGPVERP